MKLLPGIPLIISESLRSRGFIPALKLASRTQGAHRYLSTCRPIIAAQNIEPSLSPQLSPASTPTLRLQRRIRIQQKVPLPQPLLPLRPRPRPNDKTTLLRFILLRPNPEQVEDGIHVPERHIRGRRFDEQRDFIDGMRPLQVFVLHGSISEPRITSQFCAHVSDGLGEDLVDDFVGDREDADVVVGEVETEGAAGHVEGHVIGGHRNEVSTVMASLA